jgi:class 3 adenylate cyclase
MIFLHDDPHSIYYAGLNLVALCSFLFISLKKKDFVIVSCAVYLPYLAIELNKILHGLSAEFAIVNFSFIGGTLIIGVLSNIINSVLESKYVESNCRLENEVTQRGKIIKQKTRESVVLERLSAQFSPQVIQAIKSGERKITNTRQRSEICAIFVDVVNSTGRLLRLEHDDFVESIELFMEITINTLLKYDLTIDKFYGDGVLAFSNDPVKRVDFVERTCQAALEVRQEILIEQSNIRRKWRRPFEVTIGIAKGFSSVGFYGNRTYIKQYSAIGSCLARSQRLSSLAQPNEILFDQEIYQIINQQGFNCEKKGDFHLKGFGEDLFEVYSLTSLSTKQAMSYFNASCSQCSENSVYIDEKDGIYVLKCRRCGHTESQRSSLVATKKSA